MDKRQREKAIERLVDDKTDTVRQWAIQDDDSLRLYVSESEKLGDLDDEMIETLYENAFGQPIDDDGDHTYTFDDEGNSWRIDSTEG